MKILSLLTQQTAKPKPSVDTPVGTPSQQPSAPAKSPPPAEGPQAVSPRAPDSLADTPAAQPPRTPLQELAQNYRVRALSPREMTDLSFELHVAGILNFDEYSLLAFQPELHPDFDKTTGALTGQRANPNGRRDFVALWEERLAFERSHNQNDPETIDRVERILNVLRAIDTPTNIIV